MQEVLQGRTPKFEDIEKLPYCCAVVLETLRQHPPAYMIGRCTCKDTGLGNTGFSVPKGTTALIAPYLLHHDPQRWDDPGTFNPQRWFRPHSSADSSSVVNWRKELKSFGQNNSFLPFGGGPRNCIGTTFAFVEAVVVVAMVLQRFSLAPAEQAQRFPQPQPLITLRPQSVRVRVLPRAPLKPRSPTTVPTSMQVASI
jgi:cytochrome P450